jgi:PKD repeat protein/nitrous oxidase accessory protein NosD
MGRRVILAAALVLALLPWGVEAALPVDPGSGDTVVLMDITVQNEILTPNQNLKVESDATLTLINCSLVMNPNMQITVFPGASLVMRKVNVTCSNSGPLYSFLCWGRVDMDNCTVSNSQMWQLGSSSHDCSITNSTFNMAGAGIEIRNGTPLLRGNRFIAGIYKYYYMAMVQVQDSAPVLERNTFDGDNKRYDGLEVRYPASPMASNNTFINCSLALLYYYIHQHAEDGTVAPPAGEPAQFKDNRFTNCRNGLVTSDSPFGHGQGRSAKESRAFPAPDPVFLAEGDYFHQNEHGVEAYGEAPSIIKDCEFTSNEVGIWQSPSWGMLLEHDTFTNNSQGINTYSGDLSVSGSTFNTNDRNLLCDNTASKIEGNTFHGGENTSATLYSYSDISYYFANNTVSSPKAPGLRLEGTGVIFNNTFKDCPFGVYRAVRMYGQGHGRDSGQGPPAVLRMAVITQNRFENNERGIFSEGFSNISENEFTGNRAGVEASYFSHPVEQRSYMGGYTGNQYVDRFNVERNTFANNSEGVLLLVTNPYGDDLYMRQVRDNIFSNNTIGIDLLRSEAVCTGNNFSGNGGWAFRQIESATGTAGNDFGRCDRLWRQVLHPIEVREAPEGDANAPQYEYVPSDNATVEIRDQYGKTIYLDGKTADGLAPQFTIDDFVFGGVNVTTELVSANGSVYRTGTLSVEARKPGRGMAREPADPDDRTMLTLYLEPTPDLLVSNFHFSKYSATAGEQLSANFTVLNDNTYDPTNISLQDVLVEVSLDDAVFETLRIPYLRSGMPEIRHIEWTATAGNHTWTVNADPQGLFPELRKDNNRAELSLEVNGRPEALLDADRSGAYTGEPFNFSGGRSRDDGPVAAYLFDFGDGAMSDWSGNATAVHAYSRGGIYEARLKVRDDRSLESDWSPPCPVNVSNRLPSISLDAKATDVLTREPINFTLTAADPEDASLAVTWDFGYGGLVSGRDLFFVSSSYPEDGNYTVKVYVEDRDGGIVTADRCVTVRNRPPTAFFAVSPPGGTVLTRFGFLPVPSDEDGVIVSYEWDLGDGTNSTMERPAHSYKAPGTYNVSLRVKDDDGAFSGPFTLGLRVENSPPVGRARLSTGSPRAGQAVTFDGSASFDAEDPRLSIFWDFGDGTSASGAVVRHTYKRPGNYTVKARVTDGSGAVSEVVLPVTILGAEGSGADDGWRTAALGGGLLTVAGAVFLAWVLSHRPERRPAARTRVVRRVRPARGKVDVYADRLARDRKESPSPENSNRSAYDAMQPVRDEGKDR